MLGAIAARSRMVDGRLTAAAYARTLLERASRAQALNAFISLDEAAILDAARSADRRSTALRAALPLHGLPVLVKDNIASRGEVMTAGCRALAGYQPTQDAGVIQRIRSAGGIPFGRTNLHELAFGITSENTAFGDVRNPFDASRMAGGSSGGTAAAIAAGLAPLGLGTDTGGSGRIPASFCGIVGFRPSTGRYPSDGVFRLSATRDTVSPLGRAVADVRLLDAVLAGRQPAAPGLASIAGARIGIPRRPFFDYASTSVEALVNDALRSLHRAGASLVEVDLTSVSRLDARISFALTAYECRELFESALPAMVGSSWSSFIPLISSPDVRLIFTRMDAQPISREQYEQDVLPGVARMRETCAALFADLALDALAFPTTPCTAPLRGTTRLVVGGTEIDLFAALLHTASLATIAGLPAISLPIGTVDGLPVGLELDGPANADADLLALSEAVEDHLRAEQLRAATPTSE